MASRVQLRGARRTSSHLHSVAGGGSGFATMECDDLPGFLLSLSSGACGRARSARALCLRPAGLRTCGRTGMHRQDVGPSITARVDVLVSDVVGD